MQRSILFLLLLCGVSFSEEKTRTAREIGTAKPFHLPLTPSPAPAELKKNIDDFFAGLAEGNAVKAYEGLVKAQPLSEKEEEMKFMSNMTQQALTLYGKSTGSELVDTKSIGSRILSITYLTFHQRAPLRWKVICYKPQTSWILIDVVFDDGFKDWIE